MRRQYIILHQHIAHSIKKEWYRSIYICNYTCRHTHIIKWSKSSRLLSQENFNMQSVVCRLQLSSTLYKLPSNGSPDNASFYSNFCSIFLFCFVFFCIWATHHSSHIMLCSVAPPLVPAIRSRWSKSQP